MRTGRSRDSATSEADDAAGPSPPPEEEEADEGGAPQVRAAPPWLSLTSYLCVLNQGSLTVTQTAHILSSFSRSDIRLEVFHVQEVSHELRFGSGLEPAPS